MLLKPDRPVGIVGYGAYVPRYRLPARRYHASGPAARRHCRSRRNPCPDWTKTWSPCPSKPRAMRWQRAEIAPNECARCGSAPKSHPYAVKPSCNHRGRSHRRRAQRPGRRLGICLQGRHRSRWWRRSVWWARGMADYALAIGMDTAQGRPGDALEYTAAAGGAAYILGPAEESLAVIEASLFLCDRHARFLAASIPEIPRARAALHRRTGLFQAHQVRRPALMEATHTGQQTTTTPSSTNPIPNFRSGWPRCWASARSRSRPGCWRR